jgi:hypothetical protein
MYACDFRASQMKCFEMRRIIFVGKVQQQGRQSLNCKGTFVPLHALKEYRWIRGTLHSFLTSALNVDDWSTPRTCHFNPCKQSRIPLYRRLGEPHIGSGCFRGEKISHPCQDLSLGSSSRHLRHYTDCALFAITM